VIDVASLRARFPALQRRQDGQNVLYFDNPAGTQVPRETIDGVARYLECNNANLGGAFATSQETGRLIEEARRATADFLGATSPAEIVFGQNMTSLTFHLSHALACVLQPGDEIVTTRLEHDANVAPWLALQDRGAIVKWIDIQPEDATLDLERAEAVINRRTRLVAVGYASNALGTINDVPYLVNLAHAHGALVFVDAVHYAPHGSIDVQALGCDFLACSSYKFFGPHLGILYGRYEALESLPADHVRPAGNTPPDSWQTGTQSHEALAGLLGTMSYLCSLAAETRGDRRAQLRSAMTHIRAYESALTARLITGMAAIPGARVYGITDPAALDRRVPTMSFTLDGIPPHEGARALAARGIFSWAGNHYALEPLAQLGVEATQRVGLVHYNTLDEIDRFLNSIEDISRSPAARGVHG
jgi:cysteine desulfurase family protein (TIGR01976 family)